MEIIEHGKTYQVYTCPRCRCVFAACETDEYNDDMTRKNYLECPECGVTIEISKFFKLTQKEK